MRSAPFRVAACLVVLHAGIVPYVQSIANSSSPLDDRSRWLGPTSLGTFVRKLEGSGQTVCVEASTRQASSLKGRDPNLPLGNLVPDSQSTGLRIVLRGTSQLQSFPQAADAFRRAAAQWEAWIQTPIGITVDVDFGPTSFGQSFDDDVVSETDAQVLSGNSLYPAARLALISEGDTPERISLSNSLPTAVVPTDAGESAGIATSSANLRALNLIKPAVDVDSERGVFGAPPAIAFNSKFNFDFDAADGIDKDRFDFEAMAAHELGHVLGFVSSVGQRELDPAVDIQPSILDIFRIRPGNVSDFRTATRVLSSGGEQAFYSGDETLALSTGRPDGAGGDGRQAAHWKDDNLSGLTIGVMDPTLGPGEHQSISEDDALALETIGYRIRSLFLVPLVAGQPQAGAMQAPPPGLGIISHTQYSIAVPAGATGLRIDLAGNQDVDLFARFGQRVFKDGFRPESDYFSATDSGIEYIEITPSSSPPLKQGTYYIAVANFGPGDVDFTVRATIAGGNNTRAPEIFDMKGQLEGDALILDCAAVDLDRDLASAEVRLLDDAGRVLSSSNVAIDAGDSPYVASRLSLTGMALAPVALRASVTLIDGAGNRSLDSVVDFGKADAGGLTLRSGEFDGRQLRLKVSGTADSLELEVNGRILAPPLKIKVKASGGKLVINGDASQLGLRPGPNRIRVKNSSGWSNILVLSA